MTEEMEADMPNGSNTQTKPANRPVNELRFGAIKVVIWRNESRNGPMFNVTVSRLYREGESWKETHSFGHDDLPVLALALQDAYFWIRSQDAA